MFSSKHSLEEAELDQQWDALVSNSVNGTVFCLSTYLKAVNARVKPYYYRRKQEIRAAVLMIETQNGRNTYLHDFIIYNGILFAPPQNRQNRAQVNSEHFDISKFVAEELQSIYDSVQMQLHPTIVDVRPFLWLNYGTNGPKYYSDIRYTSYVDISDFSKAEKLEDISIYLQASNARRQEIRYGIRDNVKTREEFNPHLFVDFYAETMKRQNIEVKPDVLDEMKILVTTLFDAGIGQMFVSYVANGDPGSMAFFAKDDKRAYYLFGANDPRLRKAHTGTAVIWDAFYELNRCGKQEVDLEGVNSPYRGWFKLSFGGDLRPYYQLSLRSSGRSQ